MTPGGTTSGGTTSSGTTSGIGRAGNGWQLLLTDLSLILFMVTAGTLAQAVRHQRAGIQQSAASLARAPAPAQQATPLALYRDVPGAPPLARWLAEQDPDARQQLTIVAQYRVGDQGAALADAAARLRALGAAGGRARVIVEPGTAATMVTLAFDVEPEASQAFGQSARGLQGSPGSTPFPKDQP